MKKIILNCLIIVILIMPVVVLPFVVHADKTLVSPDTTSGVSQNITISNPLKCGAGQDCKTLIGFINIVLTNVIMPIAAVASVCFIIWAGFQYVLAQGNPTKIQEAHTRLLWALIGIGVLLGAAGISQVIQRTVTSLIAS